MNNGYTSQVQEMESAEIMLIERWVDNPTYGFNYSYDT